MSQSKTKSRYYTGVSLEPEVSVYLDDLAHRMRMSRSWVLNTIVHEYAKKYQIKFQKVSLGMFCGVAEGYACWARRLRVVMIEGDGFGGLYIRTHAMVLLPKHYPTMPPIGFYIHESGLNSVRGLGIDLRHLFPDKTFYGAPNLAQHGWAWFCLKFEPWKPGRYTLIGIVMMVAAMMAEGVAQ